jgi:hypothetical protein
MEHLCAPAIPGKTATPPLEADGLLDCATMKR